MNERILEHLSTTKAKATFKIKVDEIDLMIAKNYDGTFTIQTDEKTTNVGRGMMESLAEFIRGDK